MAMTKDQVRRPPRDRRRSRIRPFLVWTCAALTVCTAAGSIERVEEEEDEDRTSVRRRHQQVLPSDHPNKDDLLLNWLFEKGGYWNPKQHIGQDSSGLRGVIAGEYIEDDEILVEVPWEAVITPFHHQKDDEGDGKDGTKTPTGTTEWNESLGGSKLHPHDRRFANCDMAVRLHEELLKIQEQQQPRTSSFASDYAPYVSELQKTAQDHYDLLPAHWSKPGQELLSKVLGIPEHDGTDTGQILPPLPPNDMFFENFPWKQTCEQVTSKETVLLVMTHGEEFGMVPVTDKYNSRGGKFEGAYFKFAGNPERTIALQIRASRDLDAGESITTTYYDDEPMGVPELLRDYGYIEPYPQKYIFHSHNIGFIVSEEDDEDDEEEEDDDNDNDIKTKKLKVEWLENLSGRRYIHPKKQQFRAGRTPTTNTVGELYHALSYLHRQYDRLLNVCPTLERTDLQTKAISEEYDEQQQEHDQIRRLSEHELSMTTQFCSTMIKALEAALVDLDIIEIDDGSEEEEDDDDDDDAEEDSDEDLDPATTSSKTDEL